LGRLPDYTLVYLDEYEWRLAEYLHAARAAPAAEAGACRGLTPRLQLAGGIPKEEIHWRGDERVARS
jgi:hypothetical protein